MHMHVNKNIISLKLTWKLIKYLGLLSFPCVVVVPVPFACQPGCPGWGIPAPQTKLRKRNK